VPARLRQWQARTEAAQFGEQFARAAGDGAFGGYKVSGIGRENHKMMLDHYTQTKCLLVSYDPKPMGFF
jgi:acyl-CoA reductase-like NAD-dependent aldehyde dehydrogenase